MITVLALRGHTNMLCSVKWPTPQAVSQVSLHYNFSLPWTEMQRRLGEAAHPLSVTALLLTPWELASVSSTNLSLKFGYIKIELCINCCNEVGTGKSCTAAICLWLGFSPDGVITWPRN